MSKKNIGSKLDGFLAESAMLDEATAVAVRRVIAWQIEQEMKAQNLNDRHGEEDAHQQRCTESPAG